jgi:leucyl-tRNA synthetase
VVAEYGTDTLRVYEMFMAPFNQEVTWSTSSLQGAYRFVRRVWQIYHDADKITNDDKNSDKKLSLELQRLIVKISSDITNVKFNTPISGMMSFLNSWEEKGRCLTIDQAKTFLTLLAPFAPFITEQLWRTIFHEETSIHMAPWPKATEEALTESLINLPVQINGKVRDTIEVSPHATEAEVVGIALASEKISKWIDGKKTRHIYVPGRILNIVID